MAHYLLKKYFVMIAVITYFSPSCALTLVYNMRIRRAFNVPAGLQDRKARVLLSALPIYFGRRSHITSEQPCTDVHEKRNIFGSLFNIRYVPSRHWWGEITTGLENDQSAFCGTDSFKASRTGWDDIVFSGGYRHFFGENTQMVIYGIGGVPTRKKVDLDDRYGPLVGSRFYDLGFGAEISYAFINTLKRSLSGVIQQRFIHGFNRSWFPILPQCDTIAPGNFTDILATLQYQEKMSVYELGYDVTIFTNQAVITPLQTVPANTFTRHGAYLSATHLFIKTFIHKPIAFGGGLSASGSKQFSTKTMSAWLNITIVF